ncbi:MAG: hypothetical protein IPN76_17545 [Saprospiraceae bacterium]|nr:hypothetical protein [Saprospiraceae bacterium]
MKNYKLVLAFLISIFTLPEAQGQGWVKEYQSLYQYQASVIGMHELSDGYCFVTGANYTKVDFDGDSVLTVGFSNYSYSTNNNPVFLSDGFVLPIGLNDSLGNYFPAHRKYNYDGALIWEIPFLGVYGAQSFGKIIATQDGNLLTVARVDSANYSWLVATKLNAGNGEQQWSKKLTPKHLFNTHHTYQLVELTDGSVLNIGHVNHPLTGNKHYLIKMDANGNKLWERMDYEGIIPISSTFSGSLGTADGDIILVGGTTDFFLTIKLDSEGNVLWMKNDISGIPIELPSGNLLFPTSQNPAVQGNETILKLLTPDGDVIWEKLLDYVHEGYSGERINCLTHLASGELLLGGVTAKYTILPGFLEYKNMLVKADTFGNIYPHFITGQIFNDEALDCEFNGTEHAFADVVVKAEGPDNTYYAISDDHGEFTLNLPEGSYDVTVSTAQYWESCQPSYNLEINVQNDSAAVTIPLQPNIFCPLLDVDLATPFIRNCTTGVYVVQYCNRGTTTAQNATLQVQLSPELTYLGSTGNLASQAGQLLIFDLGNVQPFDCGSFTIQYNLECGMAEMGQTLCTEVHAFPDSPCLEEPYNGPIIEANGVCEGDSVKFIITNNGGDMPQPAEFIVIEDNIILLTNDFELNENESIAQAVEARSGSTYHLIAMQDPALPPLLGYTVATASVEGCVAPLNVGAFNQILQDDAEPWLEIDCQQVISSFDPNDKTGFPLGLSDEHFIDEHTELDYLIRFQNTGTDTAFNIVIIDTLSAFLDPATIRPGASSHSYRMELSGQGVAKFIFENILLPDSTINEPGSHGFVKFKIQQMPSNLPGTVIKNTVGIYFDHNAPVYTNTTFHTIRAPWVQVLSGSVETEFERMEVKISPNPMGDWAVVEVENVGPGENTLLLLDGMGRQVFRQDFKEGKIVLQRNGLPTGVYFFQILQNGQLAGTGKIVVH